MQRFLPLFTLITFSVVSCAGPGKVRWTTTGSDFRQDEFKQDQGECIGSIDQGLNSEAFGQALEECLASKNYKYEPIESASPKQALKTALKALEISAGVILGMFYIALRIMAGS